MVKKKAFVLRINPDLMDEIEKWASDEFRSVNGQIEWILNRALMEAGRLNRRKSDKTNLPDKI